MSIRRSNANCSYFIRGGCHCAGSRSKRLRQDKLPIQTVFQACRRHGTYLANWLRYSLLSLSSASNRCLPLQPDEAFDVVRTDQHNVETIPYLNQVYEVWEYAGTFNTGIECGMSSHLAHHACISLESICPDPPFSPAWFFFFFKKKIIL